MGQLFFSKKDTMLTIVVWFHQYKRYVKKIAQKLRNNYGFGQEVGLLLQCHVLLHILLLLGLRLGLLLVLL